MSLEVCAHFHQTIRLKRKFINKEAGKLNVDTIERLGAKSARNSLCVSRGVHVFNSPNPCCANPSSHNPRINTACGGLRMFPQHLQCFKVHSDRSRSTFVVLFLLNVISVFVIVVRCLTLIFFFVLFLDSALANSIHHHKKSKQHTVNWIIPLSHFLDT